MIKSQLFENEVELNQFLSSPIKRSVISIETVTVQVTSKLHLPGVRMASWDEERIKLWYSYSEQETCPIPAEAHSLEVFAIKDSESSPTGKEACIGYKLANGDFHFIQVPYTETFKSQEYYYICEKEPRHQANTNGIIAGPFNSLEQASEAAVNWGYVGENYLIKIANLCQ